MASSSSNSSAYLEQITQAASVELLDASHGVLGELIDPSIVLQGLQLSDNVGSLDDPDAAQATQAMHSFTATGGGNGIPIEFDNVTPHSIRVRWMDEQGNATLIGTIDPFDQIVQYTRCGHLFVLSAVMTMPADEHLLGAYRIRMKCPSDSPHQLVVEEEETTVGQSKFNLEALVADPTGQDELVIAAAALDNATTNNTAKTIKTLHTIVSNLLQHPNDPKYQSLRSSNPKVQSTLLQNFAAKQILYNIGFREHTDEDQWKYQPDSNLHAISKRLIQAKELLDALSARSQPGFVAELATPAVWQGPILNSSQTNANVRRFGAPGSTHFLSDDEKWARAERNRRRGGRGRRPNPGSAPSSNGKWGR